VSNLRADVIVVAARQSNPGNPLLLVAAQGLGLAASAPELEKKIRELPYLDVAVWRARLGEVESRVCRVEVGGPHGGYGTGFLVGPSAVMTNYHVVQTVIEGRAKPSNVRLRFDYKATPNGTAIDPGTEFSLPDRDWLIDWSPYSSADYGPDDAIRARRNWTMPFSRWTPGRETFRSIPTVRNPVRRFEDSSPSHEIGWSCSLMPPSSSSSIRTVSR